MHLGDLVLVAAPLMSESGMLPGSAHTLSLSSDFSLNIFLAALLCGGLLRAGQLVERLLRVADGAGRSL